MALNLAGVSTKVPERLANLAAFDELALCDSFLLEIHGDHGNAPELLNRIKATGKPYIAQIIHADGAHELARWPPMPSFSLSRPISPGHATTPNPHPPISPPTKAHHATPPSQRP